MARLKTIRTARNIPLGTKVKLQHALVIPIMLIASEAWTLNADLQRRLQAVEMRCLRRLLGISYKGHVTNKEVCSTKGLTKTIHRNSPGEEKMKLTEEELGRQHPVTQAMPTRASWPIVQPSGL
ncbi:hypothetical protein RRG08_017495 [Elysia crispata]|uniref:Uncharacterized protein n=1 Tax=Elysia crispata TaxID=231223 RepID=A0AAE1AHL8_9GAST|nr:hypothetical protein RRG08_017495 [Elysia crispata]